MTENPNINKPNTGSTGTTGTSGTTGTTGTTGNIGAGTAPALSQTAQQYGQKLTEVATQAKDYVEEKVSVVGDKIKDLTNADICEIDVQAKEYVHKNPIPA